jgi:ubiquinone/menaquinone biosynthesis C-methylase UbiE
MEALLMGQLHNGKTRVQWDAAAPGWNNQKALLQDWLDGPTEAMLDSAAVGPGMRVLDLAAGTGDQTRTIASRIGPGSILVTDISPAMLKLAAHNLKAVGIRNVRFECFDMEALTLPEASFDAAVCRLGLMFASDPKRVLRSVRIALRPQGRFSTIVISAPAGNPTMGIILSIAQRHAGKPPSDPFQPGSLMSLGKPGFLEELFKIERFEDVHVTPVATTIRASSVGAYLQFVQSAAAPVCELLDGLTATVRTTALAEMAAALSPFTRGGIFETPAELLLSSGRA